MSRVLALSIVVVLAACERPFVDVSQPDVVILSPDLSEVLQQTQFVLKIRAGSFRNIETVSVNGIPMQYASSNRAWSLLLNARRGLNELVIEASDVEEVSSLDTAYALYLPSQYVANSPPLPAGRGGHTTTRTRNQEFFVIGGASRVGGPAHATVYVMSPPGGGFTASSVRLSEARTGHTATLLADGRVLVVGGSRTDDIVSVADLVETPEVYNHSTRTFETWVVIGEPIRRALHTATYRRTSEGEFVYLYGGLGDTRYGSDPFLGVRRDLRTFRILNDTLVAENSLASAAYFGDPIYGHTVNRIQIGPYFVFGGRFDADFQKETSFSIEFTPSQEILEVDVPSLQVPRTRHAAAPFFNNLLFISGGRQQSATNIVLETELFSQASGTVFRLGQRRPIFSRFGHTATNMEFGEVLIIGGFGPDGTARAASEFFVVLPETPQD